MAKLTVITTSDTFVKGKSVLAGTELSYEVEEGGTGNIGHLVSTDEALLHLHASGRIVEKDSIGHREFLKAQTAQKAKETKTPKAAATA
jgi:hypothetical protein